MCCSQNNQWTIGAQMSFAQVHLDPCTLNNTQHAMAGCHRAALHALTKFLFMSCHTTMPCSTRPHSVRRTLGVQYCSTKHDNPKPAQQPIKYCDDSYPAPHSQSACAHASTLQLCALWYLLQLSPSGTHSRAKALPGTL